MALCFKHSISKQILVTAKKYVICAVLTSFECTKNSVQLTDLARVMVLFKIVQIRQDILGSEIESFEVSEIWRNYLYKSYV